MPPKTTTENADGRGPEIDQLLPPEFEAVALRTHEWLEAADGYFLNPMQVSALRVARVTSTAPHQRRCDFAVVAHMSNGQNYQLADAQFATAEEARERLDTIVG